MLLAVDAKLPSSLLKKIFYTTSCTLLHQSTFGGSKLKDLTEPDKARYRTAPAT